MPLRRQTPGEFQIGSYTFRVVPMGARVAVHCALFPTAVYSRPAEEARDPESLVRAAARAMTAGSYTDLDVPRGMTPGAWRAAIADLRGELDAEEGAG